MSTLWNKNRDHVLNYIYTNYMNIIEDEKLSEKEVAWLVHQAHQSSLYAFLLLFLYPGYTYTLILKAWLDVRFLEIAYWFI